MKHTSPGARLSVTHSLRRDLERLLKVFFGSSFILLLDRFLNTIEQTKEKRQKQNEQHTDSVKGVVYYLLPNRNMKNTKY